jgi:hypothetical protein
MSYGQSPKGFGQKVEIPKLKSRNTTNAGKGAEEYQSNDTGSSTPTFNTSKCNQILCPEICLFQLGMEGRLRTDLPNKPATALVKNIVLQA